jgi:hypothetical protein
MKIGQLVGARLVFSLHMRLERHIPKQSYNKEQKTAGFNKGKT